MFQSLHRDAKFWDAIANRKQKSRKRRSRKFVSSSQVKQIFNDFQFNLKISYLNLYNHSLSFLNLNLKDQFSILDEVTAEDLPEQKLLNLSSPVPPKSSNVSGMSDLDLIMLLGNVDDDITLPADALASSDSSYATPLKSTPGANKVENRSFHFNIFILLKLFCFAILTNFILLGTTSARRFRERVGIRRYEFIRPYSTSTTSTVLIC